MVPKQGMWSLNFLKYFFFGRTAHTLNVSQYNKCILSASMIARKRVSMRAELLGTPRVPEIYSNIRRRKGKVPRFGWSNEIGCSQNVILSTSLLDFPDLEFGYPFPFFGESLPKAVCKSLPPFNPSSYKVSHESRSSEFIGISRKEVR